MGPELKQVAALLVMGAMLWLWGRSGHRPRASKNPPELAYFVHVPPWLAWVCGKPREDSRLELGAMIVQLAVILQLVMLPLLVVFPLGFRERAYISVLVWSGGVGIAFVLRVVYVLWQVLGHRSGTRS